MSILHLFMKLFSSNENRLMEKLSKSLFGSMEEKESQLNGLVKILDNRYKPDQVENALMLMTYRFSIEGNKSMQCIVDEGLLHRPDNPFTRGDALKIYRFVAKKNFQKLVPNGTDEIFEDMFESIGNTNDGATTDVISGAYGEYGLCETNPIPTCGISSNEVYLRKLALLSGERFHWQRIASFYAPNIENPIDGYEIITDSGEFLCTIYISPYQKVISDTAPKGFYIKEKGI